MSAETVTTWADGFGIWHARIDFPSGCDATYADGSAQRIRAKARRAIRREIELRQTPDSLRGYQVRVFVKATDLDAQKAMRSITYAEVAADRLTASQPNG